MMMTKKNMGSGSKASSQISQSDGKIQQASMSRQSCIAIFQSSRVILVMVLAFVLSGSSACWRHEYKSSLRTKRGKTQEFFSNLKLDKEKTVIAAAILKEIKTRLRFMTDVGLGYLTLDRKSSTLAGERLSESASQHRLAAVLSVFVMCSTSYYRSS